MSNTKTMKLGGKDVIIKLTENRLVTCTHVALIVPRVTTPINKDIKFYGFIFKDTKGEEKHMLISDFFIDMEGGYQKYIEGFLGIEEETVGFPYIVNFTDLVADGELIILEELLKPE